MVTKMLEMFLCCPLKCWNKEKKKIINMQKKLNLERLIDETKLILLIVSMTWNPYFATNFGMKSTLMVCLVPRQT